MEFFVLRKYRRQSVGTMAARDVIGRFPGPWQLRQLHDNASATAFWRGVITVDYTERKADRFVVQEFLSGPR